MARVRDAFRVANPFPYSILLTSREVSNIDHYVG
jgi:hypothetical protein